jgi:S1-C subfamily serine protease
MSVPLRTRTRFLGAALLGAALLLAPRGDLSADDDVSPEAARAEAYAEALERAEGIEDGFIKAVDKVRINSVTVLNMRERKVPGQAEPVLFKAGGGSGVIISRNNKLWILTNVHVTAGHKALQVVTHDGVYRDVELHDSIPEYDIALLKFKEKPRRVKFRGVTVRKSNSERGLREGTWVIATGNPFFLAEDGRSVTTRGVISGLGRFLGNKYQYVGAIQHDAAVNPGNSGGPLWDLRGRFIGINGMISMGHRIPGVRPTNTGAAFALPAHQIDAYLRKLVDDEDAEAGFLGLACETATDNKGKSIGARVMRVDPRSPMAKDKERPTKGDLITSIIIKGSQKRIYTASDLRELVSVLQAGTEITLKYKRGRKYKRWKGPLGDKKR